MRDTTKLHPELQKVIPKFLDKCKKRGLEVRITECFRTVAEQDALYAQGRTKPGNIITNAPGYSYASMHQWGVAFDICRNDGKGAYYNDDGWFSKVGKIGQSLGLEWGGAWTGFVDRPHFQLPDWGSTTSRLRALYGTTDNFKKTWGKVTIPDYADKAMGGLEDLLEFRAAVKALQIAVNQEHSPKDKLPKTGFPDKALLAAAPQIKLDAKDSMPKTVKALQKLLKCQGYDVNIKGNFGSRTQAAVLKFKGDHKIDSDSAVIKAGGKFWKELLQI